MGTGFLGPDPRKIEILAPGPRKIKNADPGPNPRIKIIQTRARVWACPQLLTYDLAEITDEIENIERRLQFFRNSN